MSYEVSVNRDRSNAMKTFAGRVLVSYLENIYFGILDAEFQAGIEGVNSDALAELVDLIEKESIGWYQEVQAMDQVFSQGPFARKLFDLTMQVRESAVSKKESGYVTDQPLSVPNREHYFKSRLEGVLNGVIDSINNAAGNSGLGYIVADPLDHTRTWDWVMRKRAGLPDDGGGFGIPGGSR